MIELFLKHTRPGSRLLFTLGILMGLVFNTSQAQQISLCEAAQQEGLYASEGGYVFNAFDLQESFALEEHSELLPYMAALGKAFAANGIVPVTALLPTRPMVYAEEMVNSSFDADTAWQTYQNFRNALNQRGFLTPDLLFSFRTAESEGIKTYFKLDHHWTPEGANVAAEEVRKALNFLDSYQTLEKTVFTTIPLGEETYRGSRIAEVDQLCGEVEVGNEVFHRKTTEGEVAPAASSLFGDITRPDVVYVGTSNGEDTLNFPGALKEHLGLNVLKANLIGGASYTAMLKFLLSDDYQLEGYRPSFLVWEVNINTTMIESEEILDFADTLSLRQLIPSVYGQCDGQSLLNGEGVNQLVLDNLEEKPIAGSNYYVYVNAANAALPQINLDISYRDGRRESVVLNRPTRLQGPNRFFLELSDFFVDQLSSVSIQVPQGFSSQLSAQLCHTGETAARSYNFRQADLLQTITVPGLDISGLDEPEQEAQSTWRWALGPRSELKFLAGKTGAIKLDMGLSSPIQNQIVDVVFNNKVLASISELREGQRQVLVLDAQEGLNRLELRFADWNGHQTTFAETDTRPLAAIFSTLSLSPTTEAVSTEEVQPQVDVVETETIVTDASAPSSTPAAPVVGRDVARIQAPADITLSGLAGVENDAGRWALGPDSSLGFTLNEARDVTIDFIVFNPIENQRIEVYLNEVRIDTLSDLAANTIIEKGYTVSASPGDNTLRFAYRDWNGNDSVFSQGDSRPMAVFFQRLRLLTGGDTTDQGESLQATITETPSAPSPTQDVPQNASSNETSFNQVLPILNLGEGNFIRTSQPQSFRLQGIAATEADTYRWALGPRTSIDFRSDRAQALEVKMSFFNPIQGQSLEVTFNGATIQNLSQLHQGTEMNLKFFVNAIPGMNQLTISYGDWNGNTTTFAPDDSRPMALLFNQLEVSQPSP